jgi:hypothetical protein
MSRVEAFSVIWLSNDKNNLSLTLEAKNVAKKLVTRCLWPKWLSLYCTLSLHSHIPRPFHRLVLNLLPTFGEECKTWSSSSCGSLHASFILSLWGSSTLHSTLSLRSSVTLRDQEHKHKTAKIVLLYIIIGDRGGTVVKVLCYKSECRWFDSRWCRWNFSLI